MTSRQSDFSKETKTFSCLIIYETIHLLDCKAIPSNAISGGGGVATKNFQLKRWHSYIITIVYVQSHYTAVDYAFVAA